MGGRGGRSPIVEIRAEAGDRIGRGAAFGLAQRDGETILATSAHVVRGARSIRVRTGADEWVAARLVRDLLDTNPGADFALLAIAGEHPTLPTGAPDPDCPNLAIAGPDADPPRRLPVRLRAIRHDARGTARLLEFAGDPRPGDSGSPLIDCHGRAVGIAIAVTDDARGIGYALALEGVLPEVEEFR